ncbi:hypothetical protein Tco_0060281 [Tanacetum coccineum]
MAVTTLVSFLLPSIGLDQVPWNELDLPDFTTIERVYLLVCFIGNFISLDYKCKTCTRPTSAELYPHLDNGIYDVVERVMRPLALRQTRRPRSDRGKASHSVSSTFAHHNHGSSSHQGDDDEDDGASRASTPSPTTYLNSLGPLDYQPYDIPTSSEQNDDLLFKHQDDLLNQTQQMHKELRGGFKSFGKALRGSGAAEAWWAHNPQVPQIKVSHPPRFYQDLKKFYWLSSRGVVLEVSRRVKGEIQLDDKLHFIEEPVEIMDREVKQLKQSRIPIVKVRWNSRRGPEFTWEREDFFMKKYPHLFPSKKRGRTATLLEQA